MTPEKKKRLLRYGIAVDLVIVVTGVALLLPQIPPALIVALYAIVVAVSAVKGGWQAAVAATAVALVALLAAFHATVPLAYTAGFAATGAAIALIARFAKGPVAMRTATATHAPQPLAPVVAFPDEAPREREDDRERQRADRERAELARKLEEERAAREAAEKAAAAEKLAHEQALERQRAAAEKLAKEKAAAERAAAERLANEKAEAERAAAEKAERERAELARQLEEQRAAAEKLAKEKEAAERAAAEKLAHERELARQLEEQRAAAEKLAKEKEAAERAAAERLAKEKADAERAAAEKAERERAELARQLEEQRAAAEKLAKEKEAAERAAAEKAERERAELARQLEEQRAAAEKLAKEKEAAERAAAEKAERERAELARQLEEHRAAAEKLAKEKEAAERAAAEKAQRERAELARQLEEQRAAAEKLAKEKEAAERAAAEKAERERAELARQLEEQRAAAAKLAKEKDAAAAPKKSLLGSISGWFRPAQPQRAVNLKTKKISANATQPRRPVSPSRPAERRNATRKPRALMLEKRRGTADTIVPKLKQRGIEVEVVERWIDAVDEMFRFRPDVFFLDCELPDFDKVYGAVTQHSPNLPIVLTSRIAGGSTPYVRHAAVVSRPYDADAIIDLARKAMTDPNDLLANQAMPVTPPPPPAAPKPQIVVQPVLRAPAPTQSSVPSPQSSTSSDDEYLATCFNCRVQFNAIDADWCSCLTKERTLVCTNCLTCFCKAPPSYKEKFWLESPPRLFERKTAELRKQTQSVGTNPAPDEVRRPLVMLVEDDEDIQTIVQRVCNNLGYGFITANNGQDGLNLARGYRPNLILSDAFMPKLDGREMCRMLKEEPVGADMKMVVMTGLYTDTKYKSEALKRFHIDDYLAKPVSITDLINLLQRHLEGVTGLPMQEDLHELHRKEIEEMPDDGVSLADVLESEAAADGDATPDFEPLAIAEPEPEPAPAQPRVERRTAYDVCCFTCNQLFDATRAEWCTCLGRDNTLVCPQCRNCFCKAPSAYRERFWIDAPSSLFERKMIGSKRALAAKANPAPAEVRRPLILLVEDDENIQLIVRTVVTTMNYGFIVADNGQEGLTMAREYNPDLILSDAFMPKLDGREMCRLLKEDPTTARVKAIIMTGLYTDRKYRNEALSYFKVDDYVAKPLAVDDLIKLVKKHLPTDVQPTM